MIFKFETNLNRVPRVQCVQNNKVILNLQFYLLIIHKGPILKCRYTTVFRFHMNSCNCNIWVYVAGTFSAIMDLQCVLWLDAPPVVAILGNFVTRLGLFHLSVVL